MTAFTNPELEVSPKTAWTPNMVEERLVDAAQVLACLPQSRVRAVYSQWPCLVPSSDDLSGQTPCPNAPAAPPPAAIDRMEQAFGWFNWLEADDIKITWARATRVRWKPICWRLGIARATAHRRYRYALSVIAWRLSGRQVPTKRVRQFVIERTHGAQR